jgi:acyl-CoA thioester hydrolase
MMYRNSFGRSATVIESFDCNSTHMKTPHAGLEEFPLIVSYPVHWGDQDALSHVNNLIYLRWAESARIAYLARTGAWDGSAEVARGPILANISCDYRRPVTFPDTVYVGTRIAALGNSSFKMVHRIVSGNHRAVAAEVDSTLVWLDYTTGKPLPLPSELRRAMEEFEGKALPPLTRPR